MKWTITDDYLQWRVIKLIQIRKESIKIFASKCTDVIICVTYKGLMDFKHYAFTFAFTLHCPLPYSPTEIIPSNNSTFIALHYKMENNGECRWSLIFSFISSVYSSKVMLQSMYQKIYNTAQQVVSFAIFN